MAKTEEEKERYKRYIKVCKQTYDEAVKANQHTILLVYKY